jgi:signal transduction histidine kinase
MDYAIFAFAVLLGFAGLHLWLHRAGHEPALPLKRWLVLVSLLAAGWLWTDGAGRSARERIREMLEGLPPTYAQEIERMGHAQLTTETSPADPAYLALIAAQIRWVGVNPSIADIYTMRKTADGRYVFVVDSETDYDRNGRFEGDREQRTTIGEVYEKELPALASAFQGQAAFMDETYSDKWGDWVSAFYPLRDAAGRVEGVLGVDYPAARWIAATKEARHRTMAVILVFLVLLAASSTVVSLLRTDLRNRTLAEHRVSQLNEELEHRVVARTAELETTHRKLLAASHRAGMAEVATGVLHNVGNVLNSVATSAAAVSAQLRELKVEGLQRVSDLVTQSQSQLPTFLTEDPRGKKVPAYLAQFSTHLAARQQTMLEELENLRRDLEHIEAIVAMQQGYAKVSGTRETVELISVVEAALRINADALRKNGVEVIREFGCQPVLPLEKHKAMQILVNMVRNAQQACVEAARPDRRVAVRLAARGNSVAVSVADNGVGIAPHMIPNLFSHGFTTRREGHGFGLHSARLAAKELGGDLLVESEGLGRGATFTLELPLAPAADDAVVAEDRDSPQPAKAAVS